MFQLKSGKLFSSFSQMLENRLDICRLLVNEILEEEVVALCGEQYAHDKPHSGRYARYGHNPGSCSRIGAHRLNLSVPRVLDHNVANGTNAKMCCRICPKANRLITNLCCKVCTMRDIEVFWEKIKEYIFFKTSMQQYTFFILVL
jgi:hypothetical protein